jgi:hypothetical protein
VHIYILYILYIWIYWYTGYIEILDIWKLNTGYIYINNMYVVDSITGWLDLQLYIYVYIYISLCMVDLIVLWCIDFCWRMVDCVSWCLRQYIWIGSSNIRSLYFQLIITNNIKEQQTPSKPTNQSQAVQIDCFITTRTYKNKWYWYWWNKPPVTLAKTTRTIVIIARVTTVDGLGKPTPLFGKWENSGRPIQGWHCFLVLRGTLS